MTDGAEKAELSASCLFCSQRFEFDRLWMWVQKHMMPQLPSPYYGYVASQASSYVAPATARLDPHSDLFNDLLSDHIAPELTACF